MMRGVYGSNAAESVKAGAVSGPGVTDDVHASQAPARVPWRHLWKVLAFATVIRLAVFPFAENKQGDAPMRSLLAERMNDVRGAAADPRGFFQYGPLPIEVMRPFLALDRDARRSSRIPSLLAGLAVFVPFFSLAQRMGATSPLALALAGIALALGPLHIQVSTTAASEALYLLLFVTTMDRLHAGLTGRRRWDFVLAGVCGSLAAVTRYDMWLSLPAAGAAALWWGPRDRRALGEVALFLGTAAILPAAYLLWLRAATGDPLFFAHFIASDHKSMAAAVSARLGPALARVRQVVIWLLAFATALTPVPFMAVAGVIRARPRVAGPTRVVLAAAFAPIGVYLVQGLVLGQFEPLPRFAIVPGAILLPLAASYLAATRGRRAGRPLMWQTGAFAVALAIVIGVLAHAWPGRIWGGAESFEAVTRLDGEDRALAGFLERHVGPGEGVFIDPFGFIDIVIVHAARIPAARSATLAWTRTPSPTLAETRARTQASWFAAHDWSWGRTPIPDWPAESVRLGGWRVARYWASSAH
jgi:hypothetical protein